MPNNGILQTGYRPPGARAAAANARQAASLSRMRAQRQAANDARASQREAVQQQWRDNAEQRREKFKRGSGRFKANHAEYDKGSDIVPAPPPPPYQAPPINVGAVGSGGFRGGFRVPPSSTNPWDPRGGSARPGAYQTAGQYLGANYTGSSQAGGMHGLIYNPGG